MSSEQLKNTGRLLLFSAVILLSLTRFLLSWNWPAPRELSRLFHSTAENTALPGSELHSLKAILSPEATVSLITDRAFEADNEVKELFFILQNYMTPRLINPQPVERLALVFCSSPNKAAERTSLLGYKIAVDLGEGRGLAESASA